jgi:hypothetical protein
MRATLEAMHQQAADKQQGEQQQQQQSAGRSGGRGSTGGGVPAALGPLTDLTRDEGLCLYALGRWAEAAEALGSYLAAAPLAADVPLVTSVLEKVRAAQQRAAAAAAAAAAGRSVDEAEGGPTDSSG